MTFQVRSFIRTGKRITRLHSRKEIPEHFH